MENTDLLVQMLLLYNTEAHAAAQPRIMMTNVSSKNVLFLFYTQKAMIKLQIVQNSLILHLKESDCRLYIAFC